MNALVQSNEMAHQNCETCNTGYFCSRLHTVMSVLGSLINENTAPRLASHFHEVEAKLAEAGFAYPAGTRRCNYSESPDHIRAMTDELIKILGEIQRNPDDKTQDLKIFNEEVHCE